MSELKAELQEINGIGEAKADAILDVLEEYEGDGSDFDDGWLERACACASERDYERAGIYLTRALE